MAKTPQDPGIAGVIILAAGSSRRYGSDKRRAPMPDGRSMLMTTLALYQPHFADLRLVLRPGDEQLADSLDLPQEQVVFAAHADDGMGASLAAGAAAVPANWNLLAVALADMPWLQPSTMTLLLAEAKARAADDLLALRPWCQQQPGHPVLFGRGHRPALMACQGDQGARDYLRQLGSSVTGINCTDPGVVRDLDQPGSPAAATDGPVQN